MVSACIICYNQQDYIAETIEGALNQQLDAPYEIIISDDCSTDETVKLVQEYAKKDTRIKLVERQTNLGMLGNWKAALGECSGKYIAICEGDDYWTDPLKLQKQVDILEADSSVSMVFTDTATLTGSTFGEFYKDERPKQSFNLDYFLATNPKVATCSALFKREVALMFIDFINSIEVNIISADHTLWFCAGKVGNYHFLNEKTAVYRQHEEGLTGKLGGSRTWLEKGMQLNHLLAKHVSPEHTLFLHSGDWWYYMELSFLDLKEKKWSRSATHIFQSLFAAVKSGKTNQMKIVRDYLYRLRQRLSTQR